jgi:hypothetical protein
MPFVEVCQLSQLAGRGARPAGSPMPSPFRSAALRTSRERARNAARSSRNSSDTRIGRPASLVTAVVAT